jgi:hemerythrin
MRMVEWEEGYSLGIELVDRHHQHLLDLLNRSYHAIIIEHNVDEVRSVFRELIDYADYHFKAEEEMMTRFCYGRIKAHISEHATFKSKLAELGMLLSSEVKFDIEVIYFLEEWLLNHISVVDKEYAVFVKANGYEDAY